MNQRLIAEAVKSLTCQLQVYLVADPGNQTAPAVLSFDEQRCAARSLSALYEAEAEFAKEYDLTQRTTLAWIPPIITGGITGGLLPNTTGGQQSSPITLA